MKKNNLFFTLSILCATMLPIVVLAQSNQTREVFFPVGKSSVTSMGTISGYQIIDYAVTGKSGQEFTVALNSKSKLIFFNVLPPGLGGKAIYIGESDGANKFKGKLSQSGVYKIRVFLLSSVARKNVSVKFALSVSLTDEATEGSGDAKVTGT